MSEQTPRGRVPDEGAFAVRALEAIVAGARLTGAESITEAELEAALVEIVLSIVAAALTQRARETPPTHPAFTIAEPALERALDLLLCDTPREIESLGHAYEAMMAYRVARAPNGQYRLVASRARRASGSHYTPRNLTQPIVERALAPLLAQTRDNSKAILDLRVCDPAMGTGAFLLEACRQLGEHLYRVQSNQSLSRIEAMRAVAQACLYGVDKNPVAVKLARRSLALLVGEPAAEPSFPNLQCGDSLVGLTPASCAALLEGKASDERKEQADAIVRAWFSKAGHDEPIAPFHYSLAFPNVFCGGKHGFDAVIGNPPFLGGKRISTEHGTAFGSWLVDLHGVSRNVDLAAHFFRRAANILAPSGTIGFVATNSIAEGATRLGGLAPLTADEGFIIYSAHRSMPWPGSATVFISIVHLARGAAVSYAGEPHADGRPVASIDSTLRPRRERAKPTRLQKSTGLCFIGCFLRGAGFVLDERAGQELLASHPPNSPVRAFLGGEEINTSPRLEPHRYVIDLSGMSLERAERDWPVLIAILRSRVKPVRDALSDSQSDKSHKRRWWLFANTRPELRAALNGLHRCIVAPRVSKHLVFAFQPTTRVFSDQLCVFALDGYSPLGVLSSRVHELWAREHSSRLGEGLRYTPSSCVETFAFPEPDARTHLEDVARAAKAFDAARRAALENLGIGLTELHNSEPTSKDERVLAFIEARRQLDRAVLEAYGFDDLVAIADAPRLDLAPEALRSELSDRLLALNAERARAEIAARASPESCIVVA